MVDHEADLVHVPGEHHLAAGGIAGAALDTNHVAERIDRDFVAEGFEFGDDNRADAVLVAGDTGGLAETFQ